MSTKENFGTINLTCQLFFSFYFDFFYPQLTEHTNLYKMLEKENNKNVNFLGGRSPQTGPSEPGTVVRFQPYHFSEQKKKWGWLGWRGGQGECGMGEKKSEKRKTDREIISNKLRTSIQARRTIFKFQEINNHCDLHV